jgi:hypothetical protein
MVSLLRSGSGCISGEDFLHTGGKTVSSISVLNVLSLHACLCKVGSYVRIKLFTGLKYAGSYYGNLVNSVTGAIWFPPPHRKIYLYPETVVNVSLPLQ